MRRRKTPPIPTSLPRDLTLHLLRQHNPALALSVRKSTVRFMPRAKLIRATIDFDPEIYLSTVEKRKR